jgi:acetate kinase
MDLTGMSDAADDRPRLLAVNVGSSSVKLVLFAVDGGHPRPLATAASSQQAGDLRATLKALGLDAARDGNLAVVHRIVHGGPRLVATCELTDAAESEIDRWSRRAPLHNRAALKVAGWVRRFLPHAQRFAAFDTAWFADLPEVARRYALPRELAELHGLRRFGFHGLGHASLWRAWRARGDGARLISLQLGAGCSIAAVRAGRPLDTSMGYSTIEGLVMATRSGDVDPGVVTELARVERLSARGMEELLTQRSGLLGVSGISGDMRELLAAATPDAREAVELFCYRARKYVGAYLAVLGGADAIAFGGGIGESAPAIRAGILAGLEWAGIRLDAGANASATGGAHRISAGDSAVAVWTLPTDEAAEMAFEAIAAGACAPRAAT